MRLRVHPFFLVNNVILSVAKYLFNQDDKFAKKILISAGQKPVFCFFRNKLLRVQRLPQPQQERSWGESSQPRMNVRACL